jgi:phage terminase large subunit-like protein
MEFWHGFDTVGAVLIGFTPRRGVRRVRKCFRMKKSVNVGA